MSREEDRKENHVSSNTLIITTVTQCICLMLSEEQQHHTGSQRFLLKKQRRINQRFSRESSVRRWDERMQSHGGELTIFQRLLVGWFGGIETSVASREQQHMS